MATKHIDRAVRAAHAALAPVAIGDGSGFEAYLRAYELAAGLATNALPNPVAYERASLPSDTRSPLVQVFDGAWVPGVAGQRNRLWHADLTVVLEYTSDAQLVGAEDLMRAMVAAMVDLFSANPIQDGVGFAVTDGDRSHAMVEQDSMIRHVRALGLKAMVQDP